MVPIITIMRTKTEKFLNILREVYNSVCQDDERRNSPQHTDTLTLFFGAFHEERNRFQNELLDAQTGSGSSSPDRRPGFFVRANHDIISVAVPFTRGAFVCFRYRHQITSFRFLSL